MATRTKIREFISTLARMTKDGECESCLKDGETPNPDCVDEEGGDTHVPYEQSYDDAVENLKDLIDSARELDDKPDLVFEALVMVAAHTPRDFNKHMDMAVMLNESERDQVFTALHLERIAAMPIDSGKAKL